VVPTGYRSFFFKKDKKAPIFMLGNALRPGLPEVTGPQPLSLGGPLFWERPLSYGINLHKMNSHLTILQES